MTFSLADILRILEELDGRTITKDYAAPQNVNPKICSQCGGACCKRCSCHYSPDDFEEISFEYLKTKIEKGYISIEYIDITTLKTVAMNGDLIKKFYTH